MYNISVQCKYNNRQDDEGKKAENEKKNEPRYSTTSVANPASTNLSIFGKFSVRVKNIE